MSTFASPVPQRRLLRWLCFLPAIWTLHTASAAAPVHQKVAILVFNGVDIIDYTGPYEVFGYVGAIDAIYTVAATKAPITTFRGMTVTPSYTFADAPQPDVLIIPGGDISAVQNDAATLAWIKKSNVHAVYTMSVCNGAFTLANTGLLDGLRATTTAYWLPDFKAKYPNISVVTDQRVVDNGKIITTGGLTAGIDGAFHVVANMFGEGITQQVALALEYDWRPHRNFAPATLAYNVITPTGDEGMKFGDDLEKLGKWGIVSTKGTTDYWKIVKRVTSDLDPSELIDAVGKAYATSVNWTSITKPASNLSGSMTSTWKFTSRDGKPWAGTLTVQSVPSQKHTYLVTLTVARMS